MAAASIEYLREHDLPRLETLVNAAITGGQQPLGAPFIDADGWYVQAMTTDAA